MKAFATEISGIPQSKEEEEEYEKLKHANYIDWKPHLYEPSEPSAFNEWPWRIFEVVKQLMRELNEENVDLIKERYIRVKKHYYELKNKPKTQGSGAYERGFNKVYYSK